jgi:hypothetical protein
MKITTELIRSFGPCYDPVTGLDKNGEQVNSGYLSEDYEATLLQFLDHPEIPTDDKFWLVLREYFIDAKILRLFAVWCAREYLKLMDNPDPRSVKAVDVAEKFAHGEATQEGLAKAEDDAWHTARATMRFIRWDAALGAADANVSTAARWAAWAAAVATTDSDAAQDAQLKQLISML